MPALELASVSLRNVDGSGSTVFDVDPDSLDFYTAPRRGSVHRTLDGRAVFQSFGVKPRDFVLNITGKIATLETLQALDAKFRTEAEYIWQDWMGNNFTVVFTPGGDSFHPIPIPGGCTSFTYTMSLTVCTINQWLGGSF